MICFSAVQKIIRILNLVKVRNIYSMVIHLAILIGIQDSLIYVKRLRVRIQVANAIKVTKRVQREISPPATRNLCQGNSALTGTHEKYIQIYFVHLVLSVLRPDRFNPLSGIHACWRVLSWGSACVPGLRVVTLLSSSLLIISISLETPPKASLFSKARLSRKAIVCGTDP